MRNTKLRDYLFNNIWEGNSLHGNILHKYYNEGVKFPDDIILMAHVKLLEDIMDMEGVKWNDVVHNACD